MEKSAKIVVVKIPTRLCDESQCETIAKYILFRQNSASRGKFYSWRLLSQNPNEPLLIGAIQLSIATQKYAWQQTKQRWNTNNLNKMIRTRCKKLEWRPHSARGDVTTHWIIFKKKFRNNNFSALLHLLLHDRHVMFWFSFVADSQYFHPDFWIGYKVKSECIRITLDIRYYITYFSSISDTSFEDVSFFLMPSQIDRGKRM